MPKPKTILTLREQASLELARRKRTPKAQPFPVPTDFAEFAETCCTIRSGSEFVPFKLYSFQIELAKLIRLYRRVVVFKVRQVGASEVIGGTMLQDSLLNPGYSGVVLSIGQNESSKIAGRIKAMPMGVPGLRWDSNSTQELKPHGGGSVLFRPSTPYAVRSLPSVTTLFFDEVDYIARISELYAGATPAQKMAGDNARTIMVSTMGPDGELGFLWKMLTMGNDGIDIAQQVEIARTKGFHYWVDSNGWCKVLLHWKAHPVYSLNPRFLEDTQREEGLTDDQLGREYDLRVPKAGSSLFDPACVDRQAVGSWQPPNPKLNYLMGIDPNFAGADYFVAQVWCLSGTAPMLVAQYRENNQAIEYSLNEVYRLIQDYRPTLVAVESNSGGIIILERLTILLPDTRFEKVITTQTSKIQNTNRLSIMVRQGELIYPSDWSGISEMKHFSASKREATTGHDDSVMAAAVAFAWARECYPQAMASGTYIY